MSQNNQGKIDEVLDKAAEKLEIWLLMAYAAPVIAGRPVIVKRRLPSMAEADGLTSLNPRGVPVITLSPRIDRVNDREFMRLYLHELAHAKLHAPHFQRSTTDTERPGSSDYEAIGMLEREADNQAEKWLELAEAKRDKREPYKQSVLYALINHFS